MDDNPIMKATHMIFALDRGEPFAVGWCVPEWNTEKVFRSEYRKYSCRKVKKDSEKFKEYWEELSKAWEDKGEKHEKHT